jgi:hypothetical protein
MFRRETQRHQTVGALGLTTGVHPSPSADCPARPTRFSAHPRRDRRSRERARRASTSPAKCVLFRHETHATFKPAAGPRAEDILAGRLEARGRERASKDGLAACPTGMVFSPRTRRWLDEPLQLSRLNRRPDRRTHNKLAQIQSFADGLGGGRRRPVTSLPISIQVIDLYRSRGGQGRAPSRAATVASLPPERRKAAVSALHLSRPGVASLHRSAIFLNRNRAL